MGLCRAYFMVCDGGERSPRPRSPTHRPMRRSVYPAGRGRVAGRTGAGERARRENAGTPTESGGRTRVLILTGLDVRAFRGGEKYAIAVASELERRGYRATLYSKIDPHEPPRLDARALAEAIRTPLRHYRLFWPPWFPPVPLHPLEFVRAFRDHDTVFTLETTPRYIALVVTLSKILGKRVVVGWHHPSQAESFRDELRRPGVVGLRARLLRWFLRRADAVQAVSDHHLAVLRAAGLGETLVLAYPFVPERSGTRTVPRPPAFQSLFVGALERDQKGLDHLVEVARRVFATPTEHSLRIVGSGRAAGMVTDLVRELPGRVEYLGFVAEDRLADVYANADLVWLTSRSEGFPLVALEALMQGTPLVCFGIPSLSVVASIFPDGRVEPFDVEAFARRVLELARRWSSQPKEYERLRTHLRSEALGRFGAPALLPQVVAMLGLRPSGPVPPPDASGSATTAGR